MAKLCQVQGKRAGFLQTDELLLTGVWTGQEAREEAAGRLHWVTHSTVNCTVTEGQHGARGDPTQRSRSTKPPAAASRYCLRVRVPRPCPTPVLQLQGSFLQLRLLRALATGPTGLGPERCPILARCPRGRKPLGCGPSPVTSVRPRASRTLARETPSEPVTDSPCHSALQTRTSCWGVSLPSKHPSGPGAVLQTVTGQPLALCKPSTALCTAPGMQPLLSSRGSPAARCPR